MRNSRIIWPFQPLASLAPEYQEHWLEQCYVRCKCNDLLLDPDRSVVIVASQGSGLSTSFSWLEYQLLVQYNESQRNPLLPSPFLSFRYAPEQWPNSAHVLIEDGDHFKQLVGHIIRRCTEAFKDHPAKILQCPESLYAGFTWLLKEYLGSRRYESWRRTVERLLPPPESADYKQLSTKLLESTLHYPPPTRRDEIINECRDVVEYLGWGGIYALIDLSGIDWISYSRDERNRFKRNLELLLTDLRWLEEAKIGLKVGLPDTSYSFQEVHSMLRSRAITTSYEWTLPQLKLMAERSIAAACSVAINLDHVFDQRAWKLLTDDLHQIWGSVCPAGLLAIAEYVAHEIETIRPQSSDQDQAALEHSSSDIAPLEKVIKQHIKVQKLRRHLYSSFATLRRDVMSERPTVWRGAAAIKLDETLRRLFDLLWRYHGETVPNEMLWDTAGSSVSADKQISRLRQIIEPFPEQRDYIYIHRVHSYGVYLSNCKF